MFRLKILLVAVLFLSNVYAEAPIPSNVAEVSKASIKKARGAWSWLLPNYMTPLQITSFGDWVLGHPDGSIWFLDSLEGNIIRLASSSIEFNELKKREDFRDKYYTEGKVVALFNSGKVLSSDETYAYKLHPILGGTFDLNNIKIMDAAINMTILGQLHHQLQKPDDFKKKYLDKNLTNKSK